MLSTLVVQGAIYLTGLNLQVLDKPTSRRDGWERLM